MLSGMVVLWNVTEVKPCRLKRGFTLSRHPQWVLRGSILYCREDMLGPKLKGFKGLNRDLIGVRKSLIQGLEVRRV